MCSRGTGRAQCHSRRLAGGRCAVRSACTKGEAAPLAASLPLWQALSMWPAEPGRAAVAHGCAVGTAWSAAGKGWPPGYAHEQHRNFQTKQNTLRRYGRLLSCSDSAPADAGGMPPCTATCPEEKSETCEGFAAAAPLLTREP